MANQNLTEMVANLYNLVGGEVGYNDYCHAMGMLETIKAKLTLEVLGNAAGAPPVHGQNVVMQQGNVQPGPAQNVPMEQVLGNAAGAPPVFGQNVGMQQGIVQPDPAQNVPMEQGIQQQQNPGIGQLAPHAIQNIIPPVPNIDHLSSAWSDDWKPFGDTFDYISPNPIFWFSKTLTEYMITSGRIQTSKSELESFVRESPQYSFAKSGYWRDRSIPVILLCPGQVPPTTPGLLFAEADHKYLFLYWPGISKYFKKYCGSIRVSYWWKRSRTDGRFLLLVKVAKDSQLLQSSGGGGQQTGAMTAGHSNAIGGASGTAEPQDRGETSAAGASRARHGTSPHLTRGNQLSSSRVLRSMTRR